MAKIINEVKTPAGYNEINSLFGKPSNADGTLNKAWEHANISVIAPPKAWKLYYQNAPGSLMPITGIRIHNLLKDKFINVLQEVWQYSSQQIGSNPSDKDISGWLHNLRLDITGGGFNFRKITGNKTKLSLHAYGIAIDWDPEHNPRKKPITKTLPDWWYDIWKSYGWSDGRHFPTPDPMHVQFATGA